MDIKQYFKGRNDAVVKEQFITDMTSLTCMLEFNYWCNNKLRHTINSSELVAVAFCTAFGDTITPYVSHSLCFLLFVLFFSLHSHTRLYYINNMHSSILHTHSNKYININCFFDFSTLFTIVTNCTCRSIYLFLYRTIFLYS
jgi:hypothetical protein